MGANKQRRLLHKKVAYDSPNHLSVLLPVFGVGAGEASMKGIESSSYRGDFLHASPFG